MHVKGVLSLHAFRGGGNNPPPTIIFVPPDILPNADINQSRHDFLPPCMLFPLPPKIGLGGVKCLMGGGG